MKNLYERTIEDYLVQECQNYCELKKPQEGIFDEEFAPAQIYPEWKVLKVHSTKEEFDKKVFDPFCGIQKVKQTLLIQKNETKIRFKLYTYVINRGVGRKFYKKETSLRYFTYDYVKNAMYEGNVINFHKKRKFTKKVRRVIPNANPINTIRSLISNSTFCFRSHNPNSFSNTLESVNQFVRLFLSEIPGIENYRGVSNSDFSLYKMYYDKQQVKLPNNWEVFVFSYPQPKLRKIRQNKNKYIDSIMQLHQLKGDRVRKTLHKINYFNPEPFKAICNMFGEGLVLQQSDEFLKKVFEYNSYINYCNLELPKNEKKLAFEIFKLVIESKLNFYVFEDHVRFYWHLKPLEEVKWKSKDLESFNEEHLDWTERHSFYTKGSYKRLYDQKFCEEVSKHITDANGVKYYPVLLTKSSEYNEESFNQSNCVKTYSDRASSIIISLRKDSPDSKERATLEFQLYKFKNEVICKRGQSLGRFNQKLSDDWIVPLLILDERVKQVYETNDLELPKIEVKFGHKTINANGVFSSGMVLALYESELINKPKYESPKYLNWDRSIGPGNNNHYNMPLIVPLNMEEDNLF